MGVGTMPVLRSAILWLVIVILTLGFFAIMLPTALVALPFDRKRNTAHFFARSWARALLRANPGCTVIVEGEENLAAIGGNGASVLCCNHESMADIIALYYLGYPFKWISKREVFYIPLIGIFIAATWGACDAARAAFGPGRRTSLALSATPCTNARSILIRCNGNRCSSDNDE